MRILLPCLLIFTLACETMPSPPKTPAQTPNKASAQTPAPPQKVATTQAKPPKHFEVTYKDTSSAKAILTQAPPATERIELSEEDWKAHLTPRSFRILRQHDTEPPGTGDLLHNKTDGVYTCGGCGAPLFGSETKYESGTGWPSFYQPIENDRLGRTVDHKIGVPRTEVHCARCGGHLGHVFDDGPKPTGKRYCINSASLDFVPVSGTN